MKRLFCLLVTLASVTIGFSQSLSDLDNNPSFKGITIGAPISKYSDILRFLGADKGKNSYDITDQSILSIFNIKMDNGVVLEKNGKVDAILLFKTYSPGIFNVKELEVLKSSLSFKYGRPNVDLNDFSGTPTVAGVRWQASSTIIDAVYLFYGTNQPGSGLRYQLYKRNDDY